MKKIYSLLVALCSFGLFSSQESLPYYQQYLLDGDFLFNPALYGKTDKVAVNLNYQKQFSEFSESPNVQSVGMHANIFDRLGAGLSFFRDQNGPISANGVTAGMSYFIPLGDDGERKNQFSFGTAANFYNMNFDYSQLNPNQTYDPLLMEGNNTIFVVYANLGMAVKYKNLSADISVNDIPLTNDIPIINGIEPSPIKFFLNAGYDVRLTEGFYITPSFLMNLNTNSTRMFDANLLATVKGENNTFSAGASFRTVNTKAGNQNLSLSPLIKMNIKGLTFGAAYNLGLSEIQQYGGNSFMISLGYNFDNFINPNGFRY